MYWIYLRKIAEILIRDFIWFMSYNNKYVLISEV